VFTKCVGLTPGCVTDKWLLHEWKQVKPARYITNINGNSAFHRSRVGKSSTGLSG